MRLDFWNKPAPAIPPAPRREPSLRIPDEMLATINHPEQVIRPKAFDIPKPAPGVGPGNGQGMAMDDALSAMSNWGSEYGLGSEGYWLGYAYLAELTQRPEYRRISEVKAKEMTRKWIKLRSIGEQTKSDEIKDLLADMRRFKVQDCFRRCAELDGFFGRAHLYIDTGATDNPDEMKTILPLSPDKISIGGFKGFQVIEPIWTYPGQYNSTDPLRKDFYRPQTWWVMNKEIHATRLLTFIGHEMPDMLKPAYMFGGISMTQLVKPYVDLWLHDRSSVSEAVEFFSTSVLKTNMAARMQEQEGQGLIKRMQAFVRFRKNRGAFVIDKETEDFANVSMPLGTLDALQAQAQEHICSAAGMPLVKFTGITPAGLNASSDGEIRVWYDDVHADQEDLFTDQLSTVLKVLQLNRFGRIDESLTHEFVELYQLDEAGKAAVEKTKADTTAVYVQEGLISPEEGRERLSGDQDSMFSSVDLSTPAPQPLEDDEKPDLDDDADKIVDQGASGSESGANASV